MLDTAGAEDDPQKEAQSLPGVQGEGGLGGVKGERTVAELAEQFDVHPDQIQDWKSRLADGAEGVFGSQATSAEHNAQEVEKLHARLGQLAMENDFLSRVLGRDR